METKSTIPLSGASRFLTFSVDVAFGNDFAIDNIRVLDVTPQLDKTFSPVVSPG